MKIETYPWEHAIVDNYYDKELFVKMQNELVSFAESTKIKIESGSIDKDIIFSFFLSSISNRLIWKCERTNTLKVFPHSIKCLALRHISENDLQYFSHRKQYDKPLTLHTKINIIFNNNVNEGKWNSRWGDDPIHYDSPSKVLTAVTYIAPEISRGTILYDTNRKYVTEAPWKPNSTLIFAPEDFVTWHSYETIEGQYRIAISQFLSM